MPGRGIETAIETIPLLPDRFNLTIRGPFQSPEYEESLRKLASKHDNARITFAPALPVTQLVSSAASFDIGLAIFPGRSLQKQYALPNKIFEYMMAGLALVVNNSQDLKKLVEETETGIVLANSTAESLANSLNFLTAKMLEDFQNNSLTASEIYNFEKQSPPILEAYSNSMSSLGS